MYQACVLDKVDDPDKQMRYVACTMASDEEDMPDEITEKVSRRVLYLGYSFPICNINIVHD